jgi:hypothetical protein
LLWAGVEPAALEVQGTVDGVLEPCAGRGDGEDVTGSDTIRLVPQRDRHTISS